MPTNSIAGERSQLSLSAGVKFQQLASYAALINILSVLRGARHPPTHPPTYTHTHKEGGYGASIRKESHYYLPATGVDVERLFRQTTDWLKLIF